MISVTESCRPNTKSNIVDVKTEYSILSSIMCIQVWCAPAFHNHFWQKKLFLFFKNNFTRINHCKFIHHKSHLKAFLSSLPCIVCREYFSSIFNVKKVHTILDKIQYLQKTGKTQLTSFFDTVSI
jgi:hypothetical protein